LDIKRIFITGAGSGIGKATAVLFHQAGWRIGASDSSQPALDSLASQLAERCSIYCVDVREKSDLEAALAAFCVESDGQLDIMFNNAGIAIGGYFEDLPFEKTRDMIDINLVGVLNGFHAAIPYLKRTEGALCISTSSSAAIYGAAGMATYTATKYAIKGFTHAMSVELSRFGVRVADVMPGIIDTPLWAGVRYKDGQPAGTYEKIPKLNAERTDEARTIAPIEVARAVWNAYHGDRLHWYVPEELELSDKKTSADYDKRRDEILEARK
jgi:NAD(P)-dependent dehydrogenase (short-subunit alcohol dehydrogenase family)